MSAPDSFAFKPGFPEGTFETLDAKGNPIGWDMDGRSFVSLTEEGGNHFLRITNATPGFRVCVELFACGTSVGRR